MNYNELERYEIHITLFLITWIWAKFDPLQELIDILFTKILADNIVFKTIYALLTCWYCSALWLSLIFMPPLEAIGVSFCAWFIESLVQKK